jgi:hypothetical protein
LKRREPQREQLNKLWSAEEHLPLLKLCSRTKSTYIIIFINIHIILVIRFDYTCTTSKSVYASNEVAAPGPLALVPTQAPSLSEQKKRAIRPRKVKEITEAKKPKKGVTKKKKSNGGATSNKGKKQVQVQHQHLPLQKSARKQVQQHLLWPLQLHPSAYQQQFRMIV